MAVKIDISDFKCFNQLRNGEDFDQNLSEFTPNLVGNVGEKIRIAFTASLSVESSAQGTEKWAILNGRIERSSGSFKNDGLLEGNLMTFIHNWSNRFDLSNIEFSANIDTISSDGTIMTFTVTGGSQTTIGESENVGIVIAQQSVNNISTASLLRFGLIGNNEPFNFISKTSGGQQIFYAIELALSTVIGYDSLGKLKDWVTGGVTIEQKPQTTFFNLEYDIVHDFILNPWYILEFKTNLLNNTVPSLLDGDNSLKYAFDLEFRQTLTNISSAKSAITEDIEGVVGWFGENFNGFNNNYELVSIAYEDDDTTDPLEGIGINNNTKVTVIIGRKSGSMTSDFSASVHISLLPTSESEYQETETDLLQNFLFDSLTLANPDTSNTGVGIIKSVNSNINAGQLTLEYVITYDTIDKLRITENSEYMTWVQIEDSTIATGNSDRVAILADLRNYTDANFVADFLNFTKYDFFTHELVRGVDVGKTSITDGINEDGIALSTRFSSDASKSVVINTIRHALIARNLTTGIFFELDNFDVDIGATVVDGSGTQQFTVNVGRGYDLTDDDQFNLVELLTKNKVVNDQFYEGYFGQKIKWQDWLSNGGVDTVFFDASKPNDNLNFRSSNYSEKNDYEIFLATVVNVSGNDDLGRNVTGDFIELGNKIVVDDYDDSPSITGVIETFDPESLQSLGGAVLYNGKDTLFRTTYTRASAEFVDYAIHRVEPSLSLGTGIQELSSKYPFPSTNIIIPLSGENLLKVTDNGTEVITECLISGLKVQEGIDYKISSRIGAGLTVQPGLVYSVTVAMGETISLPMFNGDDSLYDFTVNFGDGSGDKSVMAYADVDRQHTYTSAGTFDIKITGTFDYIKFADSPASIIELKEWGGSAIGEASFLNCTNFTIMSATDAPNMYLTNFLDCFRSCPLTSVDPAIDTWDVSPITLMSNVFRSSSFDQNINSWDVSNVTLFSNFFFANTSFNKPLNGWDLSSATNVVNFFNGATSFNQDVSDWDVSGATNMVTMFFGATSFNNGGVALDWADTGLVTNMAAMFQNCSSFNQDVSSFDMGSVTTVQTMFQGCFIFNQDVSSWDVSSVTNMTSMFRNCTVYNNGGASLNWADSSSVTTMNGMFASATAFNQSVPFDTSSVTDMDVMFQNTTSFDKDISAFNVTSLTTAVSMFLNVTLSTSNYDALLVGWEVQSVQNNVPFHGGNSNYTGAGAGGTARAALIADHSWSITDGGAV